MNTRLVKGGRSIEFELSQRNELDEMMETNKQEGFRKISEAESRVDHNEELLEKIQRVQKNRLLSILILSLYHGG